VLDPRNPIPLGRPLDITVSDPWEPGTITFNASIIVITSTMIVCLENDEFVAYPLHRIVAINWLAMP
jgi:hypothetical protein